MLEEGPGERVSLNYPALIIVEITQTIREHHEAGSEGVCRFKAVMSYQSVMRDLKFTRCGRGTLYVMRVKTRDPWQSQQTSLEDAGRVIPPESSLLHRLGHVQSVCQSDATGDEIFLQVNPNKTFTELLDPKED
jgi:hypothetical protein